MTYYGHVENGGVVLDETAVLPDGAKVAVAILEPDPDEDASCGRGGHEPMWKIAVQMAASVPAEEWESLPTDGARNLDHYLYGAPKKETSKQLFSLTVPIGLRCSTPALPTISSGGASYPAPLSP